MRNILRKNLPHWFEGNFAASFVLNFCLREFLLSAFANRFELRCETKATDPIVLKNLPLFVRYVSSGEGFFCFREPGSHNSSLSIQM